VGRGGFSSARGAAARRPMRRASAGFVFMA